MILPTKHISVDQSMIGSGATILKSLKDPKTLSALWRSCKSHTNVRSYQRFVLTLDFLYCVGAIEMKEGFVRRIES